MHFVSYLKAMNFILNLISKQIIIILYIYPNRLLNKKSFRHRGVVFSGQISCLLHLRACTLC